MQIITDFYMTPIEYKQQFKLLDIKRPDKCPHCQHQHTLHKHGSYFRNILEDNFEEQIPVARLYCTHCRHTVSLLPSFALPFFQYSLHFIMKALEQTFLTLVKVQTHWTALFRFYKRRFYSNLNQIEMFFRDHGWSEDRSTDKKKRAIKLCCMCITFPKVGTFSQRFQKHCKQHFMAQSLYHIVCRN